MPNFSGIWTARQQMQARGASTWPTAPSAPVIGTATAGLANCASVTFTAPACAGVPAVITGYQVISTPGCFTQTGASSPLVVTGLTTGTSYTFVAKATNATGYGLPSAASNSVTAKVASCRVYSTAGTYSWVAPACVTSVAVVALGAGGSNGGGGGALRYTNAISVTPGNSYTVVVGAVPTFQFNCTQSNGGSSSFASNVVANGGYSGANGANGGSGGTGTGGNGGNGGNYGSSPFYGYYSGGGGAGGYSGNGGNGGTFSGGTAGSGTAGAGGAGGGGASGYQGCSASGGGSVGGTTGLYGATGVDGARGTGGYQTTQSGFPGSTPTYSLFAGYGGAYQGYCGAVRIVWASASRGTPSFPSTNVGPST